MVRYLFSAKEIHLVTGVSRARLAQWLDRGYFKPVLPGNGPGKRHGYSIFQVYQIVLFKYLTEENLFRLTRENAAKVTDYVDRNTSLFLSKAHYLVIDKKITGIGCFAFLPGNGRYQASLLPENHSKMIVDYGRIQRQTDSRISELKSS